MPALLQGLEEEGVGVARRQEAHLVGRGWRRTGDGWVVASFACVAISDSRTEPVVAILKLYVTRSYVYTEYLFMFFFLRWLRLVFTIETMCVWRGFNRSTTPEEPRNRRTVSPRPVQTLVFFYRCFRGL